MLTRRIFGCELSPELGRLVFVMPFRVGVAWGEVALLGPGRIFVAADAGDQRVPLVFGDRLFESDGFQLVRDRNRIVALVADAAPPGLGVDLDDDPERIL